MAERQIYLVAPPELEPGPAWLLEKAARMRDRATETMTTARELGVPLVVGTDSDHGRFPYEPLCLEQFGWTGLEAITAGTRNGAEVCGLDDVGTIAPGKRADLVVVGTDPTVDLDALTDVRMAIKHGQMS